MQEVKGDRAVPARLARKRGNSHKKGISPLLGKGQRQGSWRRVGGQPGQSHRQHCVGTMGLILPPHGIAGLQAPTLGLGVIRADPQQRIFPRGEQMRRMTQFFPCHADTPEGETQFRAGGGEGSRAHHLPSAVRGGRWPRLPWVVGLHVATPSHTDPRPAA